jgi:VanZ family protein
MSRYRLRWVALLMWSMFAVILTTQPDRTPIVFLVSRTIGRTEFGATLGHTALFGILTLLLYLTLAIRLPLRFALFGAMGVTLTIGASTEVYQLLVSGRTPSTADLLANWLGVFAIGFVIAYAHAARQQTVSIRPR